MAVAPSTVSLKPAVSCSASFTKIPRQALIAAASRVRLRGRVSEGRKGAAVQASLFSPKPAAAKDMRLAKVQEPYVYEVKECDHENPAYLRSAPSKPRTPARCGVPRRAHWPHHIWAPHCFIRVLSMEAQEGGLGASQEVGVSLSNLSGVKRKAPMMKRQKPSATKRLSSPVVTMVRSPGIRLMMSPRLLSPSAARARSPSASRARSPSVPQYWMMFSTKYPALARMAHDLLVAPASTVASEYAFSTRERVISDYRSRLTSETVEALICLQDWIRAYDTNDNTTSDIRDGDDLL